MNEGLKENFLGNQLNTICNEYRLDMNDLLSIIRIYCKSLEELKVESSKGFYHQSVSKINDKWALIDKSKMIIKGYCEDELTAYRLIMINSLKKVDVNNFF